MLWQSGANLRGRVEFPIGGKVTQPKPASLKIARFLGRSGAKPEPTVIVWMEEGNVFGVFCFVCPAPACCGAFL